MSPVFPKRIKIREVGPREGFQNFHAVVPTQAKLDLVHSLAQCGVKEIEVTSFVRADKVPQLADADSLTAALIHHEGVDYTALYLNMVGFKRCVATRTLQTKGWLYTSPSDSFLRNNSNTTVDDSLREIPEWLKLFRAHSVPLHGLMISNAFGCAYEGAISISAVESLVSRYQEALAQFGESLREVCVADTVGMGTPLSVEACVSALRPHGIPISLHLHDTRGLGLVNAYVGLGLGVETFESSVGGIGGCPFTPGAAGNIATEDLVYLCHSLGIETGIDLTQLSKSAHLCAALMGTSLPGKVYKTFPPA